MVKGDLKIKDRVVVHCSTEELAIQVLSIAHNLGYKWANGESYLDANNFQEYKSDTCYNLYGNCYDMKQAYQSWGFDIITAKEFINLHNNNTKTNAMENIKIQVKSPFDRGVLRSYDLKEVIEVIEELLDEENIERVKNNGYFHIFPIIPELNKHKDDIIKIYSDEGYSRIEIDMCSDENCNKHKYSVRLFF